jgi:hypothetical protein
MVRQLREICDVFICLDCLILVIVPNKIEVGLNTSFKPVVHWAILIKMGHHPKEFGQSIVIIQISVQILISSQDVDEVAHEIGEHGHSAQKDKCSNKPLDIAPRSVVAEPHRAQRGEAEVEANHGVFKSCVVHEFIILQEVVRIFLFLFLRRQITSPKLFI